MSTVTDNNLIQNIAIKMPGTCGVLYEDVNANVSSRRPVKNLEPRREALIELVREGTT